MSPNRRAHDHIGQLAPKLGIRIGNEPAELVIKNLEKLADADYTIKEIDIIINKVIADPKFRTLFLKDCFRAANQLVRVGLKR
jgi:hypothetical protein